MGEAKIAQDVIDTATDELQETLRKVHDGRANKESVMTQVTKDEENIHTAMIKIMEECAYASKDRKNQFHKYDYASEASFLKVVRPAMVRHDVYMTTSVTDVTHDTHGTTHILCDITFTHAPSRTTFTIQMPGSGNDKARNGSVGDKGTYKALTGAVKYALFKTFLIATGDDPEVANDQEQTEIVPIKEEDWTDWLNKLTKDLASCGSKKDVDKVSKEHGNMYLRCMTENEEMAAKAKALINSVRNEYDAHKEDSK